MQEVIYIDGQFYDKANAKISVYDHGFLYGDGVFEGIRIYGRKALRLEEHIDRLFHSAKALNIRVPGDRSDLVGIVLETARRAEVTDGYVRLIVSRGIGDLGLDHRSCKKPSIVCIVADIVLYPEELYEKGMAIVTASQRRGKPATLDVHIKSLNYLSNILAKMEAARQGFNEALMLDEDGYVTECTGDNVFIVRNGEIFTPPDSTAILCGITRQLFVELTARHGYKLTEKPFTLFNLYNADECFLTGTAAEAIPVVMVDGRTIGDGKPGPITTKLLRAFREYVKENGVSF
jgi:branched-chain amino acid aminotransferase